MKILSFSIALALGALPALGNVLLNPGFETDDATAGDVPGAADWITFDNAFTSALQANSGSNSLKLFGLGFAPSASGAFQAFPASPGDVWQFKAQAFIDSTDPITGTDFAVLKIEFFDGPDPGTANKIRELEAGANVDATTPTDVWTEFSVSATAPAGTVSMQAVLVFVEDNAVPAGGSVYFDDADFENLGPAVAVDPGVLTNNSFEDDDASGGDDPNATGWQVFDPGARFTTAGVSRFGSQCVKMFGPFVPEGGQAVYQDAPAAQYDIWTASAYGMNFKSDAIRSNNFAVVQVQFLNAGGDALATFDSTIIDENTPKNEWVEMTASGEAPAGTATARILLLHVQLSPVDGGSIFYDDASFAKTGQVDPPLEIIDIAKSGSTVNIEFLGIDGEFYELVKSETLVGAPATWTSVQSGIAGTGGVTPATDASATETKAFYAIVEQLPPS